MQFLIVTGMSGAGKTVVLRYLEDLGALCVDNLPPVMLSSFMEKCQKIKNQIVAMAVDVRSGDLFDAHSVAQTIASARSAGYTVDTLFMEASDDTLVNRYKESRREHPLCTEGLALQDAIREERKRLIPLRETATHLLDTTGVKPKALHSTLRSIVKSSSDVAAFKAEVITFGFKQGVPRDADLMFDVRFLPNPFYMPELRLYTGQDEAVRNFVMNHPVTQEFMTRTMGLLGFLLPNYMAEGKRRLVIAVGCTGGCHRSVAIAEAIARELTAMGYKTGVTHRDMAQEQAMVRARFNADGTPAV